MIWCLQSKKKSATVHNNVKKTNLKMTSNENAIL